MDFRCIISEFNNCVFEYLLSLCKRPYGQFKVGEVAVIFEVFGISSRRKGGQTNFTFIALAPFGPHSISKLTLS